MQPVKGQAVHELIAKTAKEMAGAAYEEAAWLDDTFYKMYPNQERFIEAQWYSFVKAARGVLSEMLSSDQVEDTVKNQIYEALQLDLAVPRS